MSTNAPILFDRAARRKHAARHAATRGAHDFLWRETAEMLDESLQIITHSFPTVLVLDPSPYLAPMVAQRPGTQQVVTHHTLAMDEELLPFADNALDAVISNLSMHAVNDLPGLFIQIRRALKPDGLFLAALPGMESLRELRQVLADAETAQRGGITPRISPFPEVRDVGNLLQRAGFALPVVDSSVLTIAYPDMFALMKELRGAGEANMLTARAKHFTARGLFMNAATRYAAQHKDTEAGIVASAEILMLTAWKPAATQQLPARRGSGTVSFMDALN